MDILACAPFVDPGWFEPGHPAFRTHIEIFNTGITVLPSTAKNGEVSRITLNHEPGTIVTVLRQFADYLVPEYGIARLFGKSDRERAEKLISVAHPDHRAELCRQAAKG